jgi:hypothetical protein
MNVTVQTQTIRMLVSNKTADNKSINEILKMRALRTSTNSITTNGHYTMYEHFGFVSLIFKTSLIPDALPAMLNDCSFRQFVKSSCKQLFNIQTTK